jgi:hypothetical protein
LVLTFLFVLMTTQVGTGLFCLARFNRRFLREVFFRAAIYEPRIDFFRFLSVGVPAFCETKTSVCIESYFFSRHSTMDSIII